MCWERGDFPINRSERRRSTLDIIASMLDVARRGVKKTRLMYHCSMSFRQLEEYLPFILETKLLNVENDGPYLMYKISGKGRTFLKSYKRLKALME